MHTENKCLVKPQADLNSKLVVSYVEPSEIINNKQITIFKIQKPKIAINRTTCKNCFIERLREPTFSWRGDLKKRT